MQNTKVQQVPVLDLDLDAICPDFDYDCIDVPSPMQCFLGNMPCDKDQRQNIGLAGGVCPLLEMARNNNS